MRARQHRTSISRSNSSLTKTARVQQNVTNNYNALQTTITNNYNTLESTVLYPVVLFGDGSDGAMVADGSNSMNGATLSGGNYFLNRDVFFASLTLSTIIRTQGYRIFVRSMCTLMSTAVIEYNGQPGGNGASEVGGAGAAGLGSGTIGGSAAGANGIGGGPADFSVDSRQATQDLGRRTH